MATIVFASKVVVVLVLPWELLWDQSVEVTLEESEEPSRSVRVGENGENEALWGEIPREVPRLVRRSEVAGAGAPGAGSSAQFAEETTPPEVIARVDPQYPRDAREARAQGIVILEIIVDENDNVEVTRVVRSVGFGLDQAAIEAVQQWRFSPATRNGQPIPFVTELEINFTLN
jgi:TonB family protein